MTAGGHSKEKVFIIRGLSEMCSWSRFRGAGNSKRLSLGEVKHQLTLSTLLTLWVCQVSSTKWCCFSLEQFMCSVLEPRQAHSLFSCLFGSLTCVICRGLDYQSFHSLGVSQVGWVLGSSANVWALASSCDGHYLPSICPPPLLTLK